MEIKQHLVYLSLGSNLGDRLNYLLQAMRFIKQNNCELTKISSIYETPSWGYLSSNRYLNCCVEIKTNHSPYELLEVMKNIERQLGREIKGVYSDRNVDIDILRYDDISINELNLKIPHPHLYQRAFVLIPLLDIIDISDIIFIKKVENALLNIKDKSEIIKYRDVEKNSI